ncbi:hypothetical protein Dda_6210 [Drechslerella dactyloides]|uniref:Uncharacterized protein n=1 Tax=Drechslerella dactyloides TaxID=74499 RepID=A0AAD6IV71_DREDA|nr:hypothetical protein Dda_6210 [Drechslerella dactyloides]
MSSDHITRLRPVALRSNNSQSLPNNVLKTASPLHPVKIASRYQYYADKSGLYLIDDNSTPRMMTEEEVRSLFKSFPSVHNIFDGKDGIVFSIGQKELVDEFPLTVGGRPLYVTKEEDFTVQGLFPEIMMGWRRDLVLFMEARFEVRMMTGLPDEVVQGIFRRFPKCTAVMRLRRELFLEFAEEMPQREDTPVMIGGLLVYYSPVRLWDIADEAALKNDTSTSDTERLAEDTTDYSPQLCPGVRITNYKGVATNAGLALRNRDGKERFTIALHGFLEDGVLVDSRVFHPNPQGQPVGIIRETYPEVNIGLVELAKGFSYKNESYFSVISPESLASRVDMIEAEKRFFNYGVFDSSVTGRQDVAILGTHYYDPVRPSNDTDTEDDETCLDKSIRYKRTFVWKASMIDETTMKEGMCGVPIVQGSYLDPTAGTVNKSICTGFFRYAKGPLYYSHPTDTLLDDGWTVCSIDCGTYVSETDGAREILEF